MNTSSGYSSWYRKDFRKRDTAAGMFMLEGFPRSGYSNRYVHTGGIPAIRIQNLATIYSTAVNHKILPLAEGYSASNRIQHQLQSITAGKRMKQQETGHNTAQLETAVNNKI